MLVGTLLCAAASSDSAQQPNRIHTDTPVTSACRTTGIIHVDGRLDEPDRESTPPIGPLTQRQPLESRPASEVTEVRVLFDDPALYFGIVCHEPHAGGFVATQLIRDANLDVDDRVTIVLDPVEFAAATCTHAEQQRWRSAFRIGPGRRTKSQIIVDGTFACSAS